MYNIAFDRVCSKDDIDAIWTYNFHPKHLPFPTDRPTCQFSIAFTLSIPAPSQLPVYFVVFILALIDQTEQWFEPANEEILFDDLSYRCGDDVVVGVMQLKTYGDLPALYMQALNASNLCFHHALGPTHYHSESPSLASEISRDYWLSLTHEVTRCVRNSSRSHPPHESSF